MGKPFASELLRLPATLAWARDVDVAPFRRFVEQAHGRTLVAIGAGGSFTVVEFARLLHEARGNVAIAHTPLSFLQSPTDLRDAYVVIFTASGNNRDIISTYRAACEREPRGILIVCGRKGSKVEALAANCERTIMMCRLLPAGKDGYLATNSLVAFAALTLRAFGEPITEAAPVADGRQFEAIGKGPAYYLALFGDWARPAAVDLESKLSEAGLAGVMLADYRNFAHGRHNWIDKLGDQSAVVAFITPDSAELAQRTLALLPRSTPVIRLTTKLAGARAALPLLMQVFHLTAFVGRLRGIDPGRPGVPGYGRKIYHLGPGACEPDARTAREMATERKLAARSSIGSEADRTTVYAASRVFLENLVAQRFGALVIDFDGTVVRPGAAHDATLMPAVRKAFERLLARDIPIYFATGRGDSIHPVLTASLAKRFHGQVFVSYYNGSVTRRLDEAPPQPQEGAHGDIFDAVLKELMADPRIKVGGRPSNKGFQLTLKAEAQADFSFIAARIREVVDGQFGAALRVVHSSHSVDVIPHATTKLNCVRFAASRLAPGSALLTVGDRGGLPGNDFDLLTHAHSLSVDTVSAALDSCWNFLPAGVRNVSGLLHLAKHWSERREEFRVKPSLAP